METELVNAINSMNRIELWYDPGSRIVEPHVIGRSSDGNILLRAYQTEGASESGEHENWKLFRVDRIDSIKTLDERFNGSRPLYNPNDKAMRGGIIARV